MASHTLYAYTEKLQQKQHLLSDSQYQYQHKTVNLLS